MNRVNNRKPEYQLGEKVEFTIDLQEVNFDRACSDAYRESLRIFRADNMGHLNNVEGSERHTDSIEVKFLDYQCSGGMDGRSHLYRFETWVEREEEEE